MKKHKVTTMLLIVFVASVGVLHAQLDPECYAKGVAAEKSTGSLDYGLYVYLECLREKGILFY